MAGTTETSPRKVKNPTYRYVASTIQGKQVKGTVKAASEIAAERLVIGKGLNPSVIARIVR